MNSSHKISKAVSKDFTIITKIKEMKISLDLQEGYNKELDCLKKWKDTSFKNGQSGFW